MSTSKTSKAGPSKVQKTEKKASPIDCDDAKWRDCKGGNFDPSLNETCKPYVRACTSKDDTKSHAIKVGIIGGIVVVVLMFVMIGIKMTMSKKNSTLASHSIGFYSD